MTTGCIFFRPGSTTHFETSRGRPGAGHIERLCDLFHDLITIIGALDLSGFPLLLDYIIHYTSILRAGWGVVAVVVVDIFGAAFRIEFRVLGGCDLVVVLRFGLLIWGLFVTKGSSI